MSNSAGIQFGWRIPDFPVDGSAGRAFSDQIVATLAAIDGSFQSAWAADHFLPWAGFQQPLTDVHECWSTIAFLAGRFSSFTFGNIVLSQSYRSPALLAKMAATLQTFCNGRLVLGLGAGWKTDEYLAYGYEFPPTPTRIAQLAEAAQILKLMWSVPQPTFHGQFYHIENAICEPKPRPVPPLLIGGGGKRLTLRVVAQHADWWNFPGGSLDHYAELLATLRAHCREVGRSYESIVKTWSCECVAIGPSLSAAQERAAASPFYHPDESIVGTPAQVRAQLQRFADLGVTHFILRFADFPRLDGIRLFAEEVIPAME
jgi:alkanesulfonate monooxygenase SsuD/methylene tetrahydromethanopterin reductase-like flavin-dependent oxidoreductase (luciferase family)